MMPIVRIEHAVPDFERWKQAFDRDPADRKGSGVRSYQILRLRDDPNYVLIDLEFATDADANAFLVRMREIWSGAGASVMRSPTGRVAEVVESRQLSPTQDQPAI